MSEARAEVRTVYICECGRKLISQKASIAKVRGKVGRCGCGLIIVAHDGLPSMHGIRERVPKVKNEQARRDLKTA